MSEKNPTIYDVAEHAGVSVSTVSRVLNEPSRVQPEKRKLVLDAIAELKFVPKADAVAHARQQFKKIGVIAPFFTQPSFMQRLRGVSSVLSGHHYELVVYAIESTKELDEYIDMLASSKRVDGLVVLCLNMTSESIRILKETGIPVCFVESDVPDFDSVIVENYKGGRMAAEYLYNRGFRKPGFIGEASQRSYAIPATDFRLKGYTDWFAEKGIAIDPENIWLGEFTEENVDRGITETMKKKNRPDCIFSSSDMIAIRFMRIAAEIGVNVPRDFGLIGFDDLDVAEYLNLPTISQSLDESGRLAAEMVLDRLKDPAREARKILVPLKVMNRGITGV